MKLISKLFVVFLFVLSITSLVKAQDKTALQVFEEWKTSQTNSTELYTLAVFAKRESNTNAFVDIVVAGEMQSYSVTVKPVKLDFDGSTENAGFSATSTSTNGISNTATSNPKLTVEITPEANVLQISLNASSNPPVSVSLTVPLKPEGYSSLMTAKPSQSANNLENNINNQEKSKILKVSFNSLMPPNCYTVQLNCGNGCSTTKECKYCSGGSESHHGNCTSCTITCGCGNCGIQG